MSDPARAVLCNFDLSTPGKGDVAWPTSTIEYPGKVATLTSFEAPDTGIVYGFEGLTDVGIGFGTGLGIHLGGATPVFNFASGALEITQGASITMDTGVIGSGDGAVNLPAFYCLSSPLTGLYRAGSNQLGVTCNGSNVATFTTTGLQLATVLAGAYGGTGVANTGKTITVSGNTTIGSSTHTVAFATEGNTSITLPTTGTIASLAGSETLTNKTINGSNNTITNVSLTSGVTGTLPVANGGTGITAYGQIARVRTPGTSSDQTFTTGVTTKITIFTNELEDASGLWDASNSRTEVLPAGKYLFMICVAADTSTWEFYVYDDGVQSTYPGYVGNHPAAHPVVQGIIIADGSSRYDFRAVQNAGGDRFIYDNLTFMGLVLIRL